MDFDYVLIAAADPRIAAGAEKRLLEYGVLSDRILKVNVPEDSMKRRMLEYFFKEKVL